MVNHNGLSTQVEMIEVTSSNIHSIGYDETSSTLYIRFRDGLKLYRYEPVPPAIWIGLRLATSAGQFFTEQIKGYFKYEHVKEPQ